ncbi:MAG TPA: hypothetical protein VLJ79_21415, partial [Candidatus Binatia bacterium]|nr:hypothetical protein [Candidatus Binatia bacterium]
MFDKKTLRHFLPPRRQERKEKSFFISPNLARFASLRETSVFSDSVVRNTRKNIIYIAYHLAQDAGGFNEHDPGTD